jgi:hypothetical protein
MTSLILAALLALPSPRAPAAAEGVAQPALSDQDIQRRVQVLLGNIDSRNLADHWKALGPRAADILEPIVQSASEFPTRRAMALDGLVIAAPERAAPVVAKLAVDEEQPIVVRMAALRGVGKTAPAATAAKSLSKVLRTDRDPGLRGAAAEVIASSGGCDQVKAQVAREDPTARLAFGRAIERCKE